MLVKQTVEDKNALEEILRHGVTTSKLQKFDFSEIVVVKPWGYEYLADEYYDKSLCAWVLHMKNNGTGTSLHCHAFKETLICVLEGSIWVKTLHDSFTLVAGDEMWIEKGTFHSMGALEEGTVLTEIESPSYKPDAIRYKDHWHREYQEYEAQCELVPVNQIHCPYRNKFIRIGTGYDVDPKFEKVLNAMIKARNKWFK